MQLVGKFRNYRQSGPNCARGIDNLRNHQRRVPFHWDMGYRVLHTTYVVCTVLEGVRVGLARVDCWWVGYPIDRVRLPYPVDWAPCGSSTNRGGLTFINLNHSTF